MSENSGKTDSVHAVVKFLRATRTGYKTQSGRLPLDTCLTAADAINAAELALNAAVALLTSQGLDTVRAESGEWADMLQQWPEVARLMDALDLARPEWRDA